MSGGIFASLTFLHPWILAGLAALPVLWWILRVTPPAPRRIDFPAARLLIGLVPEHSFPSRTPWWILLLRLCVAALILFALAHPVRDAGQALDGSGPLRLVIDNGWEAAQSWPQQTAAARDLLARAGREGRPVILLPTAPPADGPLIQTGPASAGAIESQLRGLTVQPWPADYAAAAQAAEKTEGKGKDIATLWLSSGVASAKAEALAATLKSQGVLSLLTPAPAALPLLLRPPESAAGKALSARVTAPANIAAGLPVTVQALGADGRVLDAQSLRLDPGGKTAEATFDIPDTLRNAATQIRIAGRGGAGAVVLIDESFRRRAVGIVESGGETGGKTPFIGADYYLSRALSPYAEIVQGPIEKLLESAPSLLLLPDTGAMAPGLLEKLQGWVRAGGTLVRFAGPKMAASPESFLTPVPLRSGGRAQGGAMSWDKPLHLAPFPDDSPLRDLSAPPDVTIRQQVLADSSGDLKGRVWASLEDGTPLVTAAPEGKGLLVLVHTTATPEWSDFALSGLFVEMLRKFVALSAAPTAIASGDNAAADILQPERVLDGQGALTRPGPSVAPLAAKDFATAIPSPKHPPGFYGAGGAARAFNLGMNIKSFGPLPSGIDSAIYDTRHETDLMPWLLALALALFLIDWGVMTALGGQFTGAAARFSSSFPLSLYLSPPWGRGKAAQAAGRGAASKKHFKTGMFFLFLPALLTLNSPAQAEPQDPTRLAASFHFAYVRSGSDQVDSIAEKGLAALGEVLRTRTSVEPGGVVAVEPGHDDLSFFPILYWPVSRSAQPLSDKGISAVQSYLNHGGTILFDTRDANTAIEGIGDTPGAAALRRIVGALDIPPLVPVPDDHVLTRSFYLLDSFPGRYEGGKLWVESQSVSGRDGVSSVLVGGNDWAAAWADSADSGYPTRQQEIALRFGINLVMYALTGNYKADQVHIPHILERLERRHR